MDNFFQTASTANFWIGVVMVGIILNLVSSYLKTPLDKLLSAISQSWRARSVDSKRRNQKLLASLRVDSLTRTYVWQAEVRARFQAVTVMLLGIIMLIFYVNQRLQHPGIPITQFEPIRFWFMQVTYFGSALCQFIAIQRMFAASNFAALSSKAACNSDV